MQTANSLKMTLMLGKIEGRRRRGWQRVRCLDSITDLLDMSLSKLQEMVKDREACWVAVRVVANSQTWPSDWTTTKIYYMVDAALGTENFSRCFWNLLHCPVNSLVLEKVQCAALTGLATFIYREGNWGQRGKGTCWRPPGDHWPLKDWHPGLQYLFPATQPSSRPLAEEACYFLTSLLHFLLAACSQQHQQPPLPTSWRQPTNQNPGRPPSERLCSLFWVLASSFFNSLWSKHYVHPIHPCLHWKQSLELMQSSLSASCLWCVWFCPCTCGRLVCLLVLLPLPPPLRGFYGEWGRGTRLSFPEGVCGNRSNGFRSLWGVSDTPSPASSVTSWVTWASPSPLGLDSQPHLFACWSPLLIHISAQMLPPQVDCPDRPPPNQSVSPPLTCSFQHWSWSDIPLIMCLFTAPPSSGLGHEFHDNGDFVLPKAQLQSLAQC